MIIIFLAFAMPIFLLTAYFYVDHWQEYRNYHYSMTEKLNRLQESANLTDLFEYDWQTVCLLVGFPYQYQTAEYQWLSAMLEKNINYQDIPSAFMNDGGLTMVAFVRTPQGLAKEAGFRVKEWAITENIHCTRNKGAEIIYQDNLWYPDFEYKFNFYNHKVIEL